MLNEEKQEQLVNIIENYTYELINQQLKENISDLEKIKSYVKSNISKWIAEDENELSEEVLSETIIIEEMVDIIFKDIENEINESCKKTKESDDDDSEDDEDDSEDDEDEDDSEDDEDEDEKNEATMVKHKISKIQSVLDKRMRETDPKYKMSRRRTLMKAAARGGRVINKKLSKSLKKSFRQGFGKRWENEENLLDINTDILNIFETKDTSTDNNIEGDNVTPENDKKNIKKKVAKKMAEKAKIQKEAIEESVKTVLNSIPSFGTLNEDESATLSNSFINVLSEHIDKSVVIITESLLEEMEQYLNTIIIPNYDEKVNTYIIEKVIPTLENDTNDYLDYVINEKIEEIMSTGKIYKSRNSIQLENFCDKLLNLIKENLYIVPEQEDALIAMEHKYENLLNSLKEAHIERIKMRNRANTMENTLWIEKNIPSNLSEATQEKIRLELESYETNDPSEFIKEATRIIRDSSNTIKPIEESNEIEQKSKVNSTNDDIISRTLNLMKKY